jgi:CBS domain-containing protein
LKKAGLFAIVTTARALAARHHVTERATPARLQAIKALGIGATHDLDALLDAQALFLDLILRQQVEDVAHGLRPTNCVLVKSLSGSNRARLRRALESVQYVEERDPVYLHLPPNLLA